MTKTREQKLMKTTNSSSDTKQSVAHLAWEYCEEVRNGQYVRMADYLRKLPNQRSRQAFKRLVNMDLLLTLAFQPAE
jgi:hypothetical protein